MDGLIEEDEDVVDTWYLLGWLNKLRADFEREPNNQIQNIDKSKDQSSSFSKLPPEEDDVAVIVEPDVMLAVALDEEPVPILLVDPVPVPMLLDEDSVPVLPEEDELVVTLLAVEPVPLLDSDVAVIVETDVMLSVALDEEPVPILPVNPVPVPMLLVD